VIWPRFGTDLAQAAEIATRLQTADLPRFCLKEARSDCLGHEDMRDMLDAALVAEPPVQARDGGFIAPGHDADLDAARTLRDEGRGVIAKLQADYIAETGVQSLKIKHNNVLGYFIETTATHAQKDAVPAPVGAVHPSPDHRQCGAVHDAGPVGTGDPHPERRVPRAGDRDGAVRSLARRRTGRA
jgi:hypothetical protein